MNTFIIATTEGKSLRFQGALIASVESTRLAATSGAVWFELKAYRHESGQWVMTIAIRSSDEASAELIDYYCTNLLASAEDFLYDFEPTEILPDDLTTGQAAADQSYYAAVRSLIRELEAHEQASGSARISGDESQASTDSPDPSMFIRPI